MLYVINVRKTYKELSMNDETFFDLILDCDSESQFELVCSSIFEDKDYFYTLGN